MKLTPETVNILITILLPALLLAVIQILRLTRWGRANREKLDRAQAATEYAQTMMNHNAAALRTVVKAVATADAKVLDPTSSPEGSMLLPLEAVKIGMRELLPQMPPAVQAVVEKTVASVNDDLFKVSPLTDEEFRARYGG
jgi:hypothetical protein